MSYSIRPIAPEELRAFAGVWERAFNFDEKDEELELIAKTFEFDRSIAVFDGDEIVGTGGADTFSLATPGGQVATGGLTAIAVAPTHRRRGILTQMIRFHFDDVRRRGEPLSVLRASESNIYGRFGYGTATYDVHWELDRRHAAFAADIPSHGSVRLIDKEEAAGILPGIYAQVAATWPGFLSRRAGDWSNLLADLEHWRNGMTSNRYAAYEEERKVLGYLRYRAKNEWEQGHAKTELEASELIAITPHAEAALWRYAFSIDLLSTIKAGPRPPAELLSVLLADPRRLRQRRGDGIWARLLDVQACLEGRRYQIDDRLVVEVIDPFLPEAGGVFDLRGGPDGAVCRPTSSDADLTVDAAGLASRYLGDGSFGLLRQAGRARGEPEVIRRADLMFGWEILPWCPHYF